MIWQLCGYTILLGIVFALTNREVPEAYMDEIFHIPQAQAFLAGNFSHWDSKITTLPGLYLVTHLLVVPLRLPHTVAVIRATNLLFALANFALIHAIGKLTLPAKGSSHALSLPYLPILFFFNFLYYTDPGSTCLVLLCLYLTLKSGRQGARLGSCLAAGASGCLAVLMRQTNVIWLAYSAALICVRIYRRHDPTDSLDRLLARLFAVHVTGKKKRKLSHCQLVNKFLSTVFSVRYITAVLSHCVLHVLGAVSFISFVYINGSVVVGDKSNHVAVPHFAQLFYFFAFTFAVSPTRFLPRSLFTRGFSLSKLTIPKKNIVYFMILCGLAYFAMFHFSFPHKFLLSDNRHYTFYIWKRILNRSHFWNYLLIPCYALSSYLVIRKLSDKLSVTELFLLLGSIVVLLTPQPLLEFRYFTVPCLLVALSCEQPHCCLSALELGCHWLVNGLTLAVFLLRPFQWTGEPGRLQRFMW